MHAQGLEQDMQNVLVRKMIIEVCLTVASRVLDANFKLLGLIGRVQRFRSLLQIYASKIETVNA